MSETLTGGIPNVLENKKQRVDTEDRLSQLPDVILIKIISLMTLREAASTYVLSKMWQNLWADIDSMNFDATELKFDISWDPGLYLAKMNKFVNFVSQVLKTHKNPTINHFKVSFYLTGKNKCDIDRWIDFAIKKNVKRLELNFKLNSRTNHGPYEKYRFSNNCYEYIKTPQGLSCIKSLTSLCLRSVNISGEVIEYFLSNCPVLKELAVEGSEHLTNLRVVSDKSKLRLQHLDISSCSSLEKLEISAPCLLSFRYFGSNIDMSIRDVPLLVDVSIDGHQDQTYVFSPLSSYWCKLETLALTVTTHSMNFSDLPELTNLKSLTVKIYGRYRDNMLKLIPLLNASPSITKLRFKMYTLSSPYEMRSEEERSITKIPHKNLKMVEIIGFVGCKLDREIAEYVLETSKKLEKLIIDCGRSYMSAKPKWWIGEKMDEANENAFRLKEKAPCQVEVLSQPHVIN